MITLIILWLLLGAIAVWREYHGSLKNWYKVTGESYWKFDREQGNSAIRLLLIASPAFILGGLFTLIIMTVGGEGTWWFTTPKIK